MDDEWIALEHYLLAMTARAPEGAGEEPPEPPVVPIPTADPDDVSASPTAALGAPPARG